MKFSLDPIFTGNAVFPHSKPVYVYGQGEGKVRVCFNGLVVETDCENGKWSIELPPMQCGGPYTLEAHCGEKVIVLNDIYVGEVILIGGQSNMQFKLHETGDDPDSYVTNDALRLYTVDRIEDAEYFHEKDGWVKCAKETAGYWSAIGYYIANEVNRQDDVAVGLIACYQGASMIQSWLPKTVAQREELFVPETLRHGDYNGFPLWNGDGKLYEVMLKKVIPYSVNRVVFYQGESNTTEAEGAVYDKLLLAFIETLRSDFNDPELPFTVVQIAELDSRRDEGWRSVQRAQLRAAEQAENVKTVISADICETDDIHPPTKKPLALRIVESFE